MKNISQNRILYIITYLSTTDIIKFLNISKDMLYIYNLTMSKYYIKTILHTENIFVKLSNYYSLQQKTLFNKKFYKNIPNKLQTISDHLIWFHIYLKLFKYYNISYILNNEFLMTSRVNLVKYKIYFDLISYVKKYIQVRNKYYFDSINNSSLYTFSINNWYHQLTYENFVNISYEIFSEIFSEI